MRTITALQTTKYYNSLITHNMETLRLLSTTQQVDPALFGEEYSDYIDVTEESPFKDYTTLFPKPKGLHFINANTTEVDIQHLKNDCIVPVFSKDNELYHILYLLKRCIRQHRSFSGMNRLIHLKS